MFRIFIKCPRCNSTKSKVTDKRNLNESIRRRRECLHCGFRFTTYEFIVDSRINLKNLEEKLKKIESEMENIKAKMSIKENENEYYEERKEKIKSGEEYLESIMKEEWGIDE